MSSALTLQRPRRDLASATHIPYTALLSSQVVTTRYGHYIQAFKVGGASFDAADPETLNNWHERLNILWRNIASPQVALWAQLIRDRDTRYPAGECAPGFASELDYRYRERIAGQTLMVNELYLTLVYKPDAGTQALTARLLRHSRPAPGATVDALEACAKLRQLVGTSLARYGAQILGVSIDRGRPRSHLLDFLGRLINGESGRFELPRAPLHDVLGTTRLIFGREAIEYRSPTASRFGAMLGIKEYPTPTAPGMLNALLAAPYPLILTQSFAFLTRSAGQGLLQRQYHRMTNAGDFARTQAEELKGALDQLASNQFAFGEHHFSLQVLSDGHNAPGRETARQQLTQLNERLAHARSLLADTGMVVAREDLGLEAAFWAQLPGNFSLRPRRAPITTRNFAALAPLHDYPAGRATGNHWGEALTVFKTAAGSPYFFSLHASDLEEGTGGDTGHTFLCGPTGSGKTVLIGFLVVQLTKFGSTQVIFDKDRGLEILVRALGGQYHPLRNGLSSGFNPLQLPDTPANREFLNTWLLSLLGPKALSTREEADLEQALAGTMALTPKARRLSRLIEHLDPTDPEGLHARISPWCASTGGERAWAFDNVTDQIASRFGDCPLMGFDVTEFLGNPRVRTPVTLYLFHLVRQLLDGRRLVCWLDEFWRLLDDLAFTSFAKDGPKTWRKLNAVMCLSTQSPSDVLTSPISRTIIEQTPTKIFFPNPESTPSDYREGLNLSQRETQLIRDAMVPGSRRFLVKQGRQSVVCELDLQGFDAELAVISGRADTVTLVNRLIAECGDDPTHWLPSFVANITGLNPMASPSPNISTQGFQSNPISHQGSDT